MSKVLELKEKRAKAWEAAKAFLDSKQGSNGLMSARMQPPTTEWKQRL